jgi:hypothetical protein
MCKENIWVVTGNGKHNSYFLVWTKYRKHWKKYGIVISVILQFQEAYYVKIEVKEFTLKNKQILQHNMPLTDLSIDNIIHYNECSNQNIRS